tara:strand:- start:451 stop:747 length:297 start_codon:yes stop_codon:yes gene_type:complete
MKNNPTIFQTLNPKDTVETRHPAEMLCNRGGCEREKNVNRFNDFGYYIIAKKSASWRTTVAISSSNKSLEIITSYGLVRRILWKMKTNLNTRMGNDIT